MISRRSFLISCTAIFPAPLAARAQQAGRVRRIGVLMNNAEDDPESKAELAAFRQGLLQLGWSEDRNIRIDTSFAADRPDQYQVLAKKLVALQLDAILAYTTPITAALQRESRTIPIVFAQVSDPVGSGLVASLAWPGGNLTAKSLAIELVPSPVENAADIERVLAAFAGVPNGGLLVLPSGTTTLHRDLVIALAARYRLPAVYPFRFYVKAGGLMSYSTDLVDQSRQAASYVDRILRGANPTELPVQAPIKYGVFADHSGSFFALRGNG